MTGKAGGFYTEEIRSQGIRQSFKLVTLDGQETIMAHVSIQSPYHVGKYGVDVDTLDRVGVAALEQADLQHKLVVVDEIGKMELFSVNFRKVVSQIIDSDRRLLGTIMLSPNPWADAIKQRPRVKLLLVTGSNYHQVLAELRQWLKALNNNRRS